MRTAAAILAACLCAAVVLAQPMPRADEAAAPAVLFTPASQIPAAAHDAAVLDPHAARFARYVSLYECPDALLAGRLAAIAFVTNSLSRNPVMVQPTRIIDGGNGGRVVRIDLDALGIDPAVWDTFIATGSGFAPIPEPYHYLSVAHVHEECGTPATAGGYVAESGWDVTHCTDGCWRYAEGPWRGRVVREGMRYKEGAAAVAGKKTVTHQLALAPWLPTADAVRLAELTHSQTPIVRDDWLLYYATLEPQYHLLLGLGEKLADVERVVFVDQKTADKLHSEVAGAVLHSEVALHNRALQRTPTLARYGRGYFWSSYDFNDSLHGDDVLVDLIPDETQPAAQEIIFSLPNGLQGYYVADGKGARLDKAAADVAIDARTPLRDKQVWTSRNCITCHAQGIIPIEDEVRLHATGKIALGLQGLREKDAQQAQRVVDRYFAIGLADLVTGDQQGYAAAVRSCNGLAPVANALLLQKALLAYEQPVDLGALARDTGYPPETIRGVIEHASGLDHSLVGLAQQPARLQRRDQIEAIGFGQLMQLLVLVPEVKH